MRLAIGTLATIMMASAAAPAPPADKREPAVDARTFARLLDQGRFAESWVRGGVLFRGEMTQDEWVRKATAARVPMGAVVTREVISDQRSPTLPGSPDGRYATIQFNTSFAHKHAAVETVILAFEPGGWRVDGYFIR